MEELETWQELNGGARTSTVKEQEQLQQTPSELGDYSLIPWSSKYSLEYFGE